MSEMLLEEVRRWLGGSRSDACDKSSVVGRVAWFSWLLFGLEIRLNVQCRVPLSSGD